MEDNRKGNGIFLGIVGVATLIVAIIGASFAYFSAQASSAEGAVNLTAYEFNAGLSLREIYPSDAKLIPVDPTTVIENATAPNNTNLAYALNVAKKCTDDAGFKICALYEITITNGGATNLTLEGKIVTNTNEAAERSGATAFSNLTYRPVTKNGELYTIGGTATTLNQTVDGVTATDTITVNISCTHNYISKVISATATTQGYTLHTCSICSYSYKDNYTDPLGIDISSGLSR